jgi:hypothetical protein
MSSFQRVYSGTYALSHAEHIESVVGPNIFLIGLTGLKMRVHPVSIASKNFWMETFW